MEDQTTLLTAAQFADRMKVHIATVMRWCKEGKLRYVRIGHFIRIPESEFARHTKNTQKAEPLAGQKPDIMILDDAV